jgi:hypothetical protein
VPENVEENADEIRLKALEHYTDLQNIAEDCPPLWQRHFNEALNFARQASSKIGTPVVDMPSIILTPSWCLWDGGGLFAWGCEGDDSMS